MIDRETLTRLADQAIEDVALAIQQVVAEHYPVIARMRDAQVAWRRIHRVLTQAGLRRSGESAIDVAYLKVCYWREHARRQKAGATGATGAEATQAAAQPRPARILGRARRSPPQPGVAAGAAATAPSVTMASAAEAVPSRRQDFDPAVPAPWPADGKKHMREDDGPFDNFDFFLEDDADLR